MDKHPSLGAALLRAISPKIMMASKIFSMVCHQFGALEAVNHTVFELS